jgi:hypothetical protein
VGLWKEKFPYTGARTPDILKENELLTVTFAED